MFNLDHDWATSAASQGRLQWSWERQDEPFTDLCFLREPITNLHSSQNTRTRLLGMAGALHRAVSVVVRTSGKVSPPKNFWDASLRWSTSGRSYEAAIQAVDPLAMQGRRTVVTLAPDPNTCFQAALLHRDRQELVIQHTLPVEMRVARHLYSLETLDGPPSVAEVQRVMHRVSQDFVVHLDRALDHHQGEYLGVCLVPLVTSSDAEDPS